jgi:hypothetical protein
MSRMTDGDEKCTEKSMLQVEFKPEIATFSWPKTWQPMLLAYLLNAFTNSGCNLSKYGATAPSVSLIPLYGYELYKCLLHLFVTKFINAHNFPIVLFSDF